MNPSMSYSMLGLLLTMMAVDAIFGKRYDFIPYFRRVLGWIIVGILVWSDLPVICLILWASPPFLWSQVESGTFRNVGSGRRIPCRVPTVRRKVNSLCRNVHYETKNHPEPSRGLE